MKKKFILFSIIILTGFTFAYSQVGIGTNQPSVNSMLELNSDTKGFLLPRLTSAQRNAITTPATGLVIYNSDLNCIEFWDSVKWVNFCNVNAVPVQSPVNPAAIDDISAKNEKSN